MKLVIRSAALVVLAVLVASCAALGAGSQRDPYADIVGTWYGPASPDDGSGMVNVKMVMEVVEGELVGPVSIPEQMMDGVRLQNLVYQEGALRCSVPMDDGMGGWISIFVNLVLEDGDVFNGTFDSDVIGGVMTLRKR